MKEHSPWFEKGRDVRGDRLTLEWSSNRIAMTGRGQEIIRLEMPTK